MATDFVVGDRVVFRDRLVGGPASDTLPVQQPPILGFVQDTTSDLLDVLWDNAEFSTNLPGDAAVPAAISVYRTQSPASFALEGQFVQPTGGNSPAFSGVVFALLGIETTPGSDTFIDHAVIRTPDGMYLLVQAAGCDVVPNG